MEIRFKDPDRRLNNELRSKLLDSNSALYKYLTNRRNELILQYGETKTGGKIGDARMDFHVELIGQIEKPSVELLIERAEKVEGHFATIQTEEVLGKALVIDGPWINGYGNTHITIAYFPGGVPDKLKTSI